MNVRPSKTKNVGAGPYGSLFLEHRGRSGRRSHRHAAAGVLGQRDNGSGGLYRYKPAKKWRHVRHFLAWYELGGAMLIGTLAWWVLWTLGHVWL